MKFPLRFSVLGAIVLSALLTPDADAKREEWNDTQGGSFKAEAAELLPPFALFKTSSSLGRRVPLRYLPEEDCVRFYREVQDLPPPAEDWSRAESPIGSEFPGNVRKVEGDKLVNVDLKGRPEPRVFIIVFGNNAEGKSWEMLDYVIPRYDALTKAFPQQIEALFFGLAHSRREHADMATSKKLPWLVTELSNQRNFEKVARLSPEGFGLLAVTRTGVPLFGAAQPQDEKAVEQFFAEVGGLMALIQDQSPAGWPDRVHYWSAVRKSLHATDAAPPMLIGNPLAVEGLRQRDVTRVQAALEVAADGHVSAVALRPEGIPEPLRKPIENALKKSAVFAPAVENGQAVAGHYDYVLDIP